jgi:drug/metabolite transporter (DMT)-like permease
MGNFAGVLAIVLWSATVGLFRSIGESLGPVGGPAMLFTVSGLLVVAFTGIPKLGTLNRTYLLLTGALFVAYEVCLALAIGYAHHRGQAMEVGMINYLWPCLTMLFAVLAGQQRASVLLLVPGIALSFVGIVWVMKGESHFSFSQLAENFRTNPVAYSLAFIAAFLWAAYSVLSRRFGNGKNGVGLFLLATAGVLWVKYSWNAQPEMLVTPRVVGEVLVMGTFTATAYSAWNFGVQRGSIGLLAALSYFTPVLSAFLASVWLGVKPGYAFWMGVAMVTAGSLVSWWSTRIGGNLMRQVRKG